MAIIIVNVGIIPFCYTKHGFYVSREASHQTLIRYVSRRNKPLEGAVNACL